MRVGFMAVFAVSGSMVFLVHQVHKRILSNFMKKFEFEVNGISYPQHQKNFHGIISISYFHLDCKLIRYILEKTLSYSFSFVFARDRETSSSCEEKGAVCKTNVGSYNGEEGLS